MAEKEAIMRALQEAMGGSNRPRSRPQGMGEAGKTMSDSDRLKMLMMKMGESGRTMSDADRARMKSTADSLRGIGEAGKTLSDSDMKMLELMMKQQEMKQGAAERKAFPPPSMMKNGGEVRKRKPNMGAVMKGRGGSYKGMK